MVFSAIFNQGEKNPADRVKYIGNTAEELSTVSNVSVHLQTLDKNISFCSLKYGDHRNEDCSLTYPNINKERKQIDVVSGLRTM